MCKGFFSGLTKEGKLWTDIAAYLDTLSHFFNADGLGLPIIFNALT